MTAKVTLLILREFNENQTKKIIIRRNRSKDIKGFTPIRNTYIFSAFHVITIK